MVTAHSPEILTALAAWHEAERADFERSYAVLNHDSYNKKTAHTLAALTAKWVAKVVR